MLILPTRVLDDDGHDLLGSLEQFLIAQHSAGHDVLQEVLLAELSPRHQGHTAFLGRINEAHCVASTQSQCFMFSFWSSHYRLGCAHSSCCISPFGQWNISKMLYKISGLTGRHIVYSQQLCQNKIDLTSRLTWQNYLTKHHDRADATQWSLSCMTDKICLIR